MEALRQSPQVSDSSLPLSSVLSFLLQQCDGNGSICSELSGGWDGFSKGVCWKCANSGRRKAFHEQNAWDDNRGKLVL